MRISDPLDLNPILRNLDVGLDNLESRRRELARTVERARRVLENYRRRRQTLEAFNRAHTCEILL